MKKLILAYNPVSGKAALKHRLDDLVAAFQERDCMILPYRTRAGDNTDGFLDFARAARADGIIVAGGDGTLHGMANIVAKNGLGLPMGIIGGGTSNDFATYLGIQEDHLGNYFDRIAAGHTRPVDLGLVGDEYFINVASAGMLTSIAHELDRRIKNAVGKLAYYLRGIGEFPRFRSFHLRVEADGNALETEAFLFVVINSNVVAGMKNVKREAKIDDGKLDLLIVRKCNVLELMSIATELVSGHLRSPTKNVLYLQAKTFSISSDQEMTSDLDGEYGPKLPLRIETAPSAVELYC